MKVERFKVWGEMSIQNRINKFLSNKNIVVKFVTQSVHAVFIFYEEINK